MLGFPIFYIKFFNKNIILAAEQAKALTKKYIHVIPTKNVPQGLASALAFNPDGTLEENLDAMLNAKDQVMAGSVTYAVRTTNVDGFDLEKGDIIGLDDKAILAKGQLVKDTTLQLIEKIINDNVTNITQFYGKEIPEEEAEILRAEVEQKYPACDVTLIYGGQPVYYYIISLE